MSKYIDTERLRAEIERRKELLTPHKGQGTILCREIIKQLDSLLSFIDIISQPIMKDGIIDKIRAEIERRFSEYNHDSNHHIQAAECASILDFLDSLQQEQPEVELEKEINIEISKWTCYEEIGFGARYDAKPFDSRDIEKIARHFYELGKKIVNNMTREEAIKEAYGIPVTKAQHEALQFLIPELAENDEEKIKKEIVDFIQWAEDRGKTRHDYHQAKRPAVWIAYLEKQKEQEDEHFELKAGKWYICHHAFCCRADHLTVKEGERFMCEKDGVVKGFIIKEPEKYFIECSAPAPMEDGQKEQKPELPSELDITYDLDEKGDLNMTQKELINTFKYIVKKCDEIVNNKDYQPDDFTNDIVEDIAELCNHILDGDYGKIIGD